MPKRWNSSHYCVALIVILMGVPSSYAKEMDFSSLFLPSLQKNGYSESLFSVILDGQNTGKVVLLLMKNDKLYLSGQDLIDLGFHLPAQTIEDLHEKRYISLDDITGLTYKLDSARLTIALHAEAKSFIKRNLQSKHSGYQKLSPSGNGMFFNYDTSFEQSKDQTSGSLLGEVGLFGGYGLVLGNFLLRADKINGVSNKEAIRLDTAYILNLPAKVQTLRIGDSISKSSQMWGSSVRFGGLQWGTNFSIQPDLITMPQLSIGGQAKLPSTADLYVNNIRTESFKVQPGPFSISQIPTVSGAGEMQLVVKDILGREEVINVPFYASPTLLRPSLAEYSTEIGFLRNAYGVRSDDYGAFVASGTYRRGITSGLTLGVHGEATAQTQAIGISSHALWTNVGVFSTFVATSQHNQKQGMQGGIGFDHAGSPVSVGVNARFGSHDFSDVGETSSQQMRFDGRFSLSYATTNVGSLSAMMLYRNYWENEDVEAMTLGYQLRLGRWGSFGATFQHLFVPNQQNTILCYLSIPLGERTNTSVSWQQQADGSAIQSVSLQKNLPVGSGSGYHLQGDIGARKRFEATYDYQNAHGTYHTTAVRNDSENAFRLSASGGIGYLDGSLFQSRRIDQSFAVVDVGDFQGVNVYQDNQLVGKTDKNGRVILPRLRAYQKNPIRIETKDLPMNVQIPTYEVDAVPEYRQGIEVKFPVHRIRQAMMTVKTEKGVFLPAGASIGIEGTKEYFPVGLRGEVYLLGLEKKSKIKACWRGECCEFTLVYPKTDNPLPNVGTQTCKKVVK